jgi:hypothetical protein
MLMAAMQEKIITDYDFVPPVSNELEAQKNRQGQLKIP